MDRSIKNIFNMLAFGALFYFFYALCRNQSLDLSNLRVARFMPKPPQERQNADITLFTSSGCYQASKTAMQIRKYVEFVQEIFNKTYKKLYIWR